MILSSIAHNRNDHHDQLIMNAWPLSSSSPSSFSSSFHYHWQYEKSIPFPLTLKNNTFASRTRSNNLKIIRILLKPVHSLSNFFVPFPSHIRVLVHGETTIFCRCLFLENSSQLIISHEYTSIFFNLPILQFLSMFYVS